ncbi:MAG: phosphodiester glycosidase family protein [Clostridia bacterium]|nr:phosphodiester glycosidase family protein [Clostridia bacterium]MBQ8382478.1 phosphodiester glycosidase family protein [Clostridia bacterium]
MKKERILPAWLLVLIDVVLIGAVLCSFSWFHHIKPLWYGTEDDTSGDQTGIQFTNPYNNSNNSSCNCSCNGSGTNGNGSSSNGDGNGDNEGGGDTEDPGDGYDYSGQFGSKFGNLFLKEGEEVISTATEYKSNDMWVTLTEVNRDMYYEGTGRTYTVQYFVYDIYVRNIENLYTVSVSEREPIEDLLEKTEDKTGSLLKDGIPIAAVNGDYWGNANHTEVAVRNGVVLRHSDMITSDICVLYFDGTMETYTPDEYDWDAIAARAPYQIWEFGPGLLDDNGGMITEFSNDSYDHNVIDSRHPRSSIGYYEPGHYALVVVDGRSDDSDGVRVAQIAQIYNELGCKQAYNFDGGDSAQAYFNGEMYRVDQEREEEGSGQRDLFDIVCIGEIKKN